MRTHTQMGIIAAGLILAGLLAHGAEKSHIETQDELPPHNYQLRGTAMDLVRSPEDLAHFRSALRNDISTDLATYNISDSATLQAFYKTLLRLDLLEGNYSAALAHLDRIQSFEEKNTSRLMTGLIPGAIIASKTSLHVENSEASYRAAFRDYLEHSLADLPWAVIQDRVREYKASAEYLSEDLLMGIIEAQIQPSVAATGALTSDLAARLLHLVYLSEVELPLNPIIADVNGRFLARNAEPMVDIWASRELIPPTQNTAAPVVIGIWDAGVDGTVYPDQIWVNRAEQINGRDDDGNGYADDLHGIAFDLDGNISSELLLPLGNQADDVEVAFEFMQGFWDLVSGMTVRPPPRRENRSQRCLQAAWASSSTHSASPRTTCTARTSPGSRLRTIRRRES